MSEPELLSRQRRVLRAFHELEAEPAQRQQERRKLAQEAREACQAEAEKGTRWAQAGLQQANDALGTAKKALKKVGLEQKLGRIRRRPAPKAKDDLAVELRRSSAAAVAAAAEINLLAMELQEQQAADARLQQDRSRQAEARAPRYGPEAVSQSLEPSAGQARRHEEILDALDRRKTRIGIFIGLMLAVLAGFAIARHSPDRYMVWVYAACLVAVFTSVRSYLVARELRENTIFAIEKEVAAYSERSAMVRIAVVWAIAAAITV